MIELNLIKFNLIKFMTIFNDLNFRKRLVDLKRIDNFFRNAF